MIQSKSKPETEEEKLNAPTTFVPFGSDTPITLSVNIVQKACCVHTKSGKYCSVVEAQKFILYCQSQKLNPFIGDAYLTGYDSKDPNTLPKFTPITSIYAFLKRAEANKEYDGMLSGVIVNPGWDCPVCAQQGVVPATGDICMACNGTGVRDEVVGDLIPEGQKLHGGWAKVKLKNRSLVSKKRVLLSRFCKTFGMWAEDPAGMIVKVGEVQALRDAFPSVLGGLYAKEEMPEEQATRGPAASGPSFEGQTSPLKPAVGPVGGKPTHTPPQAGKTPPQTQPGPKTPPSKPPPPPPGKPMARKPGPKPVQTEMPEPDPEPPEDLAGEPEDDDQIPGAEAPPVASGGNYLRTLNAMMVRANVNADQVVMYCFQNDFIPDLIQLDQMDEPRLKHIIANWQAFLPEIEKIEIS